jgi:hypothetical protein
MNMLFMKLAQSLGLKVNNRNLQENDRPV